MNQYDTPPRPAVFDAESGLYRIPLSQGLFSLVDPSDADLAEVHWFAKVDHKRGCRYASRTIGAGVNRRGIILHRLIMERALGRALSSKEVVDHIDGDGLNNTRSNIRLATQVQNKANRRLNKNNLSGFKGVSQRSNGRKWRAEIQVNGKRILLGTFDDPVKAHEAYCEAARLHFGEYANFGRPNNPPVEDIPA